MDFVDKAIKWLDGLFSDRNCTLVFQIIVVVNINSYREHPLTSHKRIFHSVVRNFRLGKNIILYIGK